MKENSLPCFICDKDIPDGEVMYTCSYNKEYLHEEEYTVTDSELMASVCMGCYDKNKIAGNIEVALIEELSLRPKGEPVAPNVVPIHNQLDCLVCNNPIRDGEVLISITHAIESMKDDIVEPTETWMAFYSCQPCAESTDIYGSIGTAIDNVVVQERRKRIKMV